MQLAHQVTAEATASTDSPSSRSSERRRTTRRPNTNPFFDDPGVIIVNDAHASENYISAQWTVRINRFAGEDEILFEAVAGLLNGLLTKANYVRLTGAAHSTDDVTWVDRIPTAQPVDIDRIAGCSCRQCRAGPSSPARLSKTREVHTPGN
jgi:hypothetical protein